MKEKRVAEIIKWWEERIEDGIIKVTKREARCKICNEMIDKNSERVTVCPDSKTLFIQKRENHLRSNLIRVI